jgi:NitT/TauT family transport system ATP-binding protein
VPTSLPVPSYLTATGLGLEYRFGDYQTRVLDDITFGIAEGEIVSLIGPSGCGKTTLFNILSGLLTPTSGQITLRGKSIAGSRRHAAYLFQDHSLLPWRNVLQNVLLPVELQRQSYSREMKTHHRTQALQLLAAFGLMGKTVSLYPAQLSGGMKQRAALARTFMADRLIYLFDEPFTGLDFFRRLRVEKMLSDFLRTHRKTCLLITHDLETALAVSHRVFLLSGKPCRIHREINGLVNVSANPVEARKLPEFEVRLKEATESLTEIFEAYVGA